MNKLQNMFCGIEMSAETYDDDVALRAYVHKHFSHLMTPLERRVTEYTVPIVADSTNAKVEKLQLHEFLEARDGHVADDDVYVAFQMPLEQRIANAVARVLTERRAEIIENRCPKCKRLARSPAARQCLWCGDDWH